MLPQQTKSTLTIAQFLIIKIPFFCKTSGYNWGIKSKKHISETLILRDLQVYVNILPWQMNNTLIILYFLTFSLFYRITVLPVKRHKIRIKWHMISAVGIKSGIKFFILYPRFFTVFRHLHSFEFHDFSSRTRLKPGDFFPGILKFNMCIRVKRNTNIRMSHQIL